MGRGKREALSVFPLLLFLLGYPAERPRFEKTIRATRKLGWGGRGSAEAIILVHGIVLWRGYCSFLEPAARESWTEVKWENGGEWGEEQKAEKVFSFSFSPRQYFVLCHLGITPSTTPGNSPKWAIQYVCEIKVRIPQANQKNHPYPHPPPPTFKSQMVGP